MKIESTEAKRYDWDQCKSWNYKLTHLDPKRSVVYAEVTGDHGDASSQDLERIYYIVDGNAEFTVGSEVALVSRGDVLTIPPHTIVVTTPFPVLLSNSFFSWSSGIIEAERL